MTFSSQVSPLHYAARHNHLPVLQTLVLPYYQKDSFHLLFFIDKIQFSFLLREGFSCHRHLPKCLHLSISSTLTWCPQVEYGANINVKGNDNLTPLHYAARWTSTSQSTSPSSSPSLSPWNIYRFKISTATKMWKNVKTGLVSTYLSDSGIMRVLDISEISSILVFISMR